MYKVALVECNKVLLTYKFTCRNVLLCPVTFVRSHSRKSGPLVKADCSHRYGLYAPTCKNIDADLKSNIV